MKNKYWRIAGREVKKVAEKSIETTRKGANHCLETKKMLEENQCRWQAATKKYQQAVSRVSVIIEKSHELIELCRRYGLTDETIPYPIAQTLEKNFPDCKLQQDGTFLWKGAAAGTVAVTSALSGTAFLGTASTGAAISSLHGAAAVSAALANLGGGAVAAGGFGIAGGLAALGTAFALPAIATGGYLWEKSIRKQHEKVLTYEKAVDKECHILQQIYHRYDNLNKALITWLTSMQRGKIE